MRNIGMAEMVDPFSQLNLPPGFRFHPTDEEIMVNYLCPKIVGQNLPFKIIADVDLYKYDPWVLPSKALFGEDEWYFFTLRDRKYPKGSRPNRVAGSGYWKATGTDKAITSEGKYVGIKKALVFYIGKAPRGSKTNWIMHEYRLSEPQRRTGRSKLDDLVLCRIHKKNSSAQTVVEMGMDGTECIHNYSSSSSSKFNEPIHVAMNDYSFSMNQLNDKPMVQNVGYSSSNKFDRVTFAGLNNTVPENFGSSSGVHFPIHNITELGVMNTSIHYNQDDMYVPAADTRYGRMIQLEVQNEFINQGADNSGFLNPNAYPQGFINSIDLNATVRYPNQPGNSSHKN